MSTLLLGIKHVIAAIDTLRELRSDIDAAHLRKMPPKPTVSGM